MKSWMPNTYIVKSKSRFFQLPEGKSQLPLAPGLSYCTALHTIVIEGFSQDQSAFMDLITNWCTILKYVTGYL